MGSAAPVIETAAPAPAVASTAPPEKTPAAAKVVVLPPAESSRIGLVVQPVTRSEFRTHRDFPAILQPNQRAMADITTLVRGRVVDVYADLGQQVEANALLAILYSSELGLAQSAYLKSRAALIGALDELVGVAAVVGEDAGCGPASRSM